MGRVCGEAPRKRGCRSNLFFIQQLFCVKFTEFNKAIVFSLSLLFCFSEESFCSIGEGLNETAVTSFALDEVDIACGGSLAIDGERVFTGFLLSRVVTEELPVACFNSLLHFLLAVSHTTLNTVHFARCITDDNGRTIVSFSFCKRFESLIHISAHSDLSNVYITVRHSDVSKVFLLDRLTSCCELSNLTDLRSLGCLTTGVGVNFGIEYHDVYVFAGCDYVVETTETDIVSPTVATEDPHGFLSEVVFFSEDRLASIAINLFEFCNVCFGSFFVCSTIVEGVNPSLCSSFELCGSTFACKNSLSLSEEFFTDGLLTEVDTETVFCVVFKEGVAPSRTTTGFTVYSVRSGRCGAAPNGGTTGCVGNIHSFAEELSDESGVRSFSTTCAGTGELEKGLLELATLDGVVDKFLLFGNVSNSIVECSLLFSLAFERYHFDCSTELGIAVNRARFYAERTTHTVKGRYCHGEFVVGLHYGFRSELGNCGCVCSFFFCHRERTDSSVRTYKCTAVTLDTIFCVPYGNVNGNAAFFVCSSALRILTVGHILERGYGEGIALHLCYGDNDVVNEVNELGTLAGYSSGSSVVTSGLPGFGNVNLNDRVYTGVDSLVVHFNDSFALLEVGFLSHVLHVVNSFFDGHDVSKLEECGLKDGVGSLTHTDFTSLVDRVYDIEVDVVVSDVALYFCREDGIEFFHRPLAVEKEGTTGFNIVYDLIALEHVRRCVASNEVCLGDVVGGLDGRIAEAEVRNGYTAGLLGVILEVCLDIFISVVTDNLDGVLVCTNGTVAAETPEFAGEGACGSSIGSMGFFERAACNVIDDADGEAVLGSFFRKVCINCEDGSGSGVFGTETVTAANNLSCYAALSECGNNVEVERFAEGAGFLGSVENSNLGSGLRKSCDELFSNERSVKTNFDKTNLFALSVEVVDNFFNGVTYGAHSNDYAVSVFCAVLVEEIIVGADLCIDLAHVFFNDSGDRIVVGVASFSVLEEDIAVFSGAAESGVVRVESVCAECSNSVLVEHIFEVSVIPSFDLLDLVRSTETVKEVEEGNSALDCGKMRNGSKVHDFLGVGFCEHRKTCLTASVNVAVFAEDVEGVGSYVTSGDVDNSREKFACHLVHIRDHKKKTLRCGISCGESAGSERAVNSTCSTCFGLHFHNLYLFTENVLETGRRPCIGHFSHRAGRSDGVDSGNFRKRVRNVRGGGVTVHRNLFSFHWIVTSVILDLYIYHNTKSQKSKDISPKKRKKSLYFFEKISFLGALPLDPVKETCPFGIPR